jgi:hypothetical protein
VYRFEIIATLPTVAVPASCLNHRLIPLSSTIGLMSIPRHSRWRRSSSLFFAAQIATAGRPSA